MLLPVTSAVSKFKFLKILETGDNCIRQSQPRFRFMSCLTCTVLKISGEIGKKLNAVFKPQKIRKHEIFVYRTIPQKSC